MPKRGVGLRGDVLGVNVQELGVPDRGHSRVRPKVTGGPRAPARALQPHPNAMSTFRERSTLHELLTLHESSTLVAGRRASAWALQRNPTVLLNLHGLSTLLGYCEVARAQGVGVGITGAPTV